MIPAVFQGWRILEGMGKFAVSVLVFHPENPILQFQHPPAIQSVHSRLLFAVSHPSEVLLTTMKSRLIDSHC